MKLERMLAVFTMTVAVAVSFGFPQSDDRSKFPRGYLLEGTVKSFGDGDTFEIKTKRGVFDIRFWGIDTPESKGKNWPVQPYSKQAKNLVKKLVGQNPVMVRMTGEVTYGREVGEVIVNGQSVNRELVRAGLAWWYDSFAKYDTDLKRLQLAAQAAKKGLWFQQKPIRPSKWRKMKHE